MKKRVENLNKSNLVKTFKRLKKATKNFSSLIVRDPLDYLDFEVNLDSNLESLIFEINSSNYHPQRPYLHLSAKSKGINRPTVVFDVKDGLVYRFCIEQIENELIDKTRQKNVRGGIKITPNRNNNGDDFYEKWFKDWMEHQKALQDSLNDKKYLVTTDIASYFENVNILVLKDLVRGDVVGKSSILNLLFYFLENTRFRYDYEVNTFNGLPQEDIDCSRLLAYYFLSSHDQAMGEFCRGYKAEFYRFVDDMSIVVDSEVEGKWALKRMAESLRTLNLVSSIEKTSIVRNDKAREELFFEENDRLNEIEDELKNKLKSADDLREITKEIKKFYNRLVKAKKNNQKNWIKVLKRFYSLFSYSKSNFFFDKLIDHLTMYPLLFSGDKIKKYLLQNKDDARFNEVVGTLLDYLYSQENLYPAVETSILETLLLFDQAIYSPEINGRIKQLGFDVLFATNKYKSLSNYARSIACLIIYKFNAENLAKIADHYLRAGENDNVLRKYLIFVSLAVENQALREKVLGKARKEQNLSINRLVNLVDNIDNYKNFKVVKDYIKKDEIIIMFDKQKKIDIKQEINSVRADILKKIIDIYK